MSQTKEQKKKIIDNLAKDLDKQKSIVFIAIDNLKTKELSDLRKRLKVKDCLLAVVKKTLLNLTLKKKKIAVDTKKLTGQLALVFGFGDEVSPAKITHQFSLESKNLKILAGFFDNQFRTKDEVIALAKIPSKEELLTKVVGSISAPISGFINVLQGNIKGLITVLAKAKT